MNLCAVVCLELASFLYWPLFGVFYVDLYHFNNMICGLGFILEFFIN